MSLALLPLLLSSAVAAPLPAPAQEIVLTTFDGARATTQLWREVNDPGKPERRLPAPTRGRAARRLHFRVTRSSQRAPAPRTRGSVSRGRGSAGRPLTCARHVAAVMGGRSTGTFAVDKANATGIFQGDCKIVPSLKVR